MRFGESAFLVSVRSEFFSGTLNPQTPTSISRVGPSDLSIQIPGFGIANQKVHWAGLGFRIADWQSLGSKRVEGLGFRV